MLEQRYLAGEALLESLQFGAYHASKPSPKDKPSLVLLRSATARATTLLFSGNNGEFALPANFLLDYDTHLLLVRDRRRCFSLAGIPGFGVDYEGSVVALQRIISALGNNNVYVLGISAGGAAAIKFACDLPAKRLLCFSAPTTLNLDDDPGAELKHYPQLAQLYRLDRSLGIDLAAYYRAHPKHPPAIFVYSGNHMRDSWLASRMSDIEGVQLLPTTGYDGHTTFRWLIMQKTISIYFNMLYAALPGEQSDAALLPQAGQTKPDDSCAIEPSRLYGESVTSRIRGLLRRIGRRRMRDRLAVD